MTKDTCLLERLYKRLHSLFFLERGLKDVLHECANDEILTVFMKHSKKCPNGVPDLGSKDSELQHSQAYRKRDSFNEFQAQNKFEVFMKRSLLSILGGWGQIKHFTCAYS